MKKYLKVIKISFMEHFIYRTNFLLWRLRSLISFLTLIFFWQAVYGARDEVFGYQRSQMLTYVVGISILRGIVLSGRVGDLAGMILSGDLVSKFLLRPWNVITTWFFRDLSSKILNISFVIVEVGLIIKLLNLPFYISENWQSLLLFIISCILAIPLYFLISFLLSSIAFWTDNIWAPRWLFGIIFLEFMAGTLFPLDVLPKFLFDLIHLTPFPYLVYLPINIYLERISLFNAVYQILILVFWLVIAYSITIKIWKSGLKNYTAYGD
jgi:ABC-2 type transport system permease protein